MEDGARRMSGCPYSHWTQPSAYSLALATLLLLTLLELARPNNLRIALRRPVRGQRGRQEHAHGVLVALVLRVLAGADELRQPGRPLEEEAQRGGADAGPAVQRVGGVAAPLVQGEPDQLLGGAVGVPAVGPEPRGYKATLEVGLGVGAGNLSVLSVLVLGVLEIWMCFYVRTLYECVWGYLPAGDSSYSTVGRRTPTR